MMGEAADDFILDRETDDIVSMDCPEGWDTWDEEPGHMPPPPTTPTPPPEAQGHDD
jgi:hypothetical protein